MVHAERAAMIDDLERIDDARVGTAIALRQLERARRSRIIDHRADDAGSSS